MYKVMLVDDDAIILAYLKQLIDWEGLGFTICATALSGEAALKLFEQHQPHAVITDIGLPQMNGLELAARMKQLAPNTSLVFLTCHEDFHYSRQAIQLNAEDYMLKDELSSEQLEATLKRVAESIQIAQEKSLILSSRQTIYRNRDVLKQNLLKSIKAFSAKSALLEETNRLGIQWNRSHFLVARIHLHQGDYALKYKASDANTLQYAAYNICSDLYEGSSSSLTAFLEERTESVFLVLNYQEDLRQQPQESFHRYLENATQQIQHFLKIRSTASWLTKVYTLDVLGYSLRDLDRAELNSFYSNEEVVASHAKLSMEWDYDYSGYAQQLTETFKKTTEMDSDKVTSNLEELANWARSRNLPPLEWRKTALASWRSAISPDTSELEPYMNKSVRIEELITLLSLDLKSRTKTGSSTKPASSADNPQLLEIDRYITTHLSHNITSIDIANYLHLNPSYFSRYFKGLSGENFTDYVHNYKMNLACSMLQEGINVEDVAFKLGYSDRTYFAKVFKKYIGQTPGDFIKKKAY